MKNIETWSINNDRAYTERVAVSLTLNHLFGFDNRDSIDAKSQKLLFGFNVFGRQTLYLTEDNKICVSKKVCFGQDMSSTEIDIDRVMKIAESKQKFTF